MVHTNLQANRIASIGKGVEILEVASLLGLQPEGNPCGITRLRGHKVTGRTHKLKRKFGCAHMAITRPELQPKAVALPVEKKERIAVVGVKPPELRRGNLPPLGRELERELIIHQVKLGRLLRG